MDEIVIKAVQKIASTRAKHNFDYETVEYICEAMLELSTAIVQNEKEGDKDIADNMRDVWGCQQSGAD